MKIGFSSLNGIENRLIKKLLKNPRITFGGCLILVVIIMALVAPYIPLYHPLEINVMERLMAPNVKHWLGTDALGRDLLSRIIWGARTTLWVGFASTILAGLIGILVGLISGYYHKVDSIIMRFMDGIMAFPE